MSKLYLCYIILLLCVHVVPQKTILDSPVNLQIYRSIRNWIFDTFGKTGQEGGRLLNEAKDQRKIQERIPDDVPFPCNVTGGRSATVPTSVHRLRPGDIDVIAAMGDSLTAGAGIFGTQISHVVIENRGVVAPVGGQGTWREFLTLPNILKEFNPNLVGYALGDALIYHSASQLNVAEIGAMSSDMPFMAEYLIQRMKNHPSVDIKNHWKMIFISIGSNDFCNRICAVSSPESILEEHKDDMINTLRILRDNLPRTMVIVSPPPYLEALVLTREGSNSLMCYFSTIMECPCMLGLMYRDQQSLYYDINRRWQELEEEVCNYSEFQTNDFVVLYLPVLKNSYIPTGENGLTDLSYLSADCFHVSQKANAIYANGLWNNLLEPFGNKRHVWSKNLFDRFLCPTPENPYIVTRLNSEEFNRLT